MDTSSPDGKAFSHLRDPDGRDVFHVTNAFDATRMKDGNLES
jgi:hypothetical protein